MARARKSLGQNFLVDVNHQRRIVDALDVRPGDTVLEIGPGRGALTDHLVERTERLVAVELDDALARELAGRFGDRPHVRVVHADFMDYDLREACETPERLVVIGNIPYNITTPILFKLLQRPRPRELLLMVQKEVADRIVAEPGTSDYGALAVGVRVVADAAIVLRVPSGAFRPVPKVESAVVRVTPHRPPRLSETREAAVRRVVRAAFQWRRKQLQKILRSHPELTRPGILDRVRAATGWDLTRRPQTLSPDDFVRLAGLVAEDG